MQSTGLTAMQSRGGPGGGGVAGLDLSYTSTTKPWLLHKAPILQILNICLQLTVMLSRREMQGYEGKLQQTEAGH